MRTVRVMQRDATKASEVGCPSVYQRILKLAAMVVCGVTRASSGGTRRASFIVDQSNQKHDYRCKWREAGGGRSTPTALEGAMGELLRRIRTWIWPFGRPGPAPADDHLSLSPEQFARDVAAASALLNF